MGNITNLTIQLSKPTLSVSAKLKIICKAIKQLVPNADRVSLWAFTEQKSEIFCLMCLNEANEFEFGQILKKNQFTPYFDYILQNRILNAGDARTHTVTQCFTDSYFEPLNIHSLLDLIFHYDFVPTGVICCEHTEQAIEWQESDITALQRIASLTTLFFAKDIAEIGLSQSELTAALNQP